LSKKKYYVVWVGVEPGIYDNWNDCQAQIKGYPNAKYKSFKTKQEAEFARDIGYQKSSEMTASAKRLVKGPKGKQESFIAPAKPILTSLSVDAGCIGNPGLLEYQGVMTDSRKRVFYQGPFLLGTNNIGEFLAIVHALAWLKKKGDEVMIIYTDSRTAMKWIRNKRAKTSLVKNEETQKLYELIERAEKWLKSNTYKNKILKWDTENWGEIPADFGRK
jgi:ribonuclease HI